MNHVGKPEQVTQNRIVRMFEDRLGYQNLGDWSDRAATAISTKASSPPT